MAKLFSMHPSHDQLDLYLLGRLSPGQARFLEEHYLICPECVDRLSDLQEFIALLRAARLEMQLPLIRRKPAARLGAILLVAAGTALWCDAPAPSISAAPANGSKVAGHLPCIEAFPRPRAGPSSLLAGDRLS